MTTFEQFLASLVNPEAVHSAEHPDLDIDGDALCRSVVEDGEALLQSQGLEAAARFLSASMFRLLISRRAALLRSEPPLFEANAEESLVG